MRLKVLLTCLLLFTINFTSFSQGRWAKVMIKGDELLGQSADTSYVYTATNQDQFFYYKNSKLITISTSKGILDYDESNQIPIKIGYYAHNDNLIWSSTIWFHVIRSTPETAYCDSNDERAQTIIDYLKSDQGYIRIVGKIYGHGIFDLKMPCTMNHASFVNKRVNTSKKKTTAKRKNQKRR